MQPTLLKKFQFVFGETIKSYVKAGKNLNSLIGIPLAVAGWLRYLLAIDDNGIPMELSSDPQLTTLKELLSGVKFGDPISVKGKVKPILSLFGPEFAQISDKVEEIFQNLIVGPRTALKTLAKYLLKPTQMTLRWFGPSDSISLAQIRQIPGVVGVISTLYDTQPGEVWPRERIHQLKATVEASNLILAGIESVNVHDSIKIGSSDRDEIIQNYITTLENLGEEGIKLICYNFMPVFDWTRSELAKERWDGSTVLAYDQSVIDATTPSSMFESNSAKSNGFVMPGWEPERMVKIKELFELYKDVDETRLFDNLVYFLRKIMPTCDKYGINMAIHPDDPAWSVFGLPRIITSKEKIAKLFKAVDNPHNGLTFCSGSLGTSLENNLPDIIRAFKGRIHFAHVRNLQHFSPGVFEESAHLSRDGSFDMFDIVKALYDIDFDGPIRPDHGRTIWGEISLPGYGLYDRALGATYINGLWEAIAKAY